VREEWLWSSLQANSILDCASFLVADRGGGGKLNSARQAGGTMWSGKSFALEWGATGDVSRREFLTDEIIRHGGSVVSDLRPTTTLVLEHGADIRRPGRGPCVSTLWVEACVSKSTVLDPGDVPLLFRPQHWRIQALPSDTAFVVCISTYEGSERVAYEALVQRLGATLSPNLTRTTTHLVCPKPEGDKFKTAARFGIKTVSGAWLIECARSGWTPESAAKHAVLAARTTQERAQGDNGSNLKENDSQVHGRTAGNTPRVSSGSSDTPDPGEGVNAAAAAAAEGRPGVQQADSDVAKATVSDWGRGMPPIDIDLGGSVLAAPRRPAVKRRMDPSRRAAPAATHAKLQKLSASDLQCNVLSEHEEEQDGLNDVCESQVVNYR